MIIEYFSRKINDFRVMFKKIHHWFRFYNSQILLALTVFLLVLLSFALGYLTAYYHL